MKKLLVVIGILIAFIIISLIVPKETKPSKNTRIILEHTYQSYIAPTCFEQAEATNYLEDSTLGEARELSYEAHDACTEEALSSVKESLFVSLLKDIGFIQKEWDKW